MGKRYYLVIAGGYGTIEGHTGNFARLVDCSEYLPDALDAYATAFLTRDSKWRVLVAYVSPTDWTFHLFDADKATTEAYIKGLWPDEEGPFVALLDKISTQPLVKLNGVPVHAIVRKGVAS